MKSGAEQLWNIEVVHEGTLAAKHISAVKGLNEAVETAIQSLRVPQENGMVLSVTIRITPKLS